MKVLFVHGVNVQQNRFQTLLATVSRGISRVRSDIVTDGFYWGDMGTSHRYRGRSIPGFHAGKRAVLEAGEMLSDLATRSQLLTLVSGQYLGELQALEDAQEFDPGGAGVFPLPPGVAKRNHVLWQSRTKVTQALFDDPQLGAKIRIVMNLGDLKLLVDRSFDSASRADRRLDIIELIDPLTRSMTSALYNALTGPTLTFDPGLAWCDVEQPIQYILEVELGGQRGCVGDILRDKALVAATAALRHFRQTIMGSMSLFIGDILVYLTRREEILAQLEAKVAAFAPVLDEPIWLIGHSMGGIICFDYCSRTDRVIDRLATVGSQVGLFGELGAMKHVSCSHDDKIPAPERIVEWRNIYDPNDLLSFLSASVFTKAVDIEIDTRAPFPAAHSEYWSLPIVYEKLIC